MLTALRLLASIPLACKRWQICRAVDWRSEPKQIGLLQLPTSHFPSRSNRLRPKVCVSDMRTSSCIFGTRHSYHSSVSFIPKQPGQKRSTPFYVLVWTLSISWAPTRHPVGPLRLTGQCDSGGSGIWLMTSLCLARTSRYATQLRLDAYDFDKKRVKLLVVGSELQSGNPWGFLLHLRKCHGLAERFVEWYTHHTSGQPSAVGFWWN